MDLDVTSDRILMVSSDGHASARMDDYRSYLPSNFQDEFDRFCVVYREKGSRNFEVRSMSQWADPEVIQDWKERVIDTGRVEGLWNISSRLDEMARNGLAAEVLFPDFGLPFELYSPLAASTHRYRRTREQIDVANRAYNRWLVDFCSDAPERFAGLALMAFDDVDAAVSEMRWAKDAGLKGVILPMFSEEYPIFHPRYDPIWLAAQELEMPVNSHIALSGITEYTPTVPPVPHPAAARPIFKSPTVFFCHQILNHLIWGGVLERHPNLQVVFTEQGSGWVISEIADMDYSWEGSFLRRDIRELIPRKPSEYFSRQCHLGSSIFSRAEVEARHLIGVDKIMIGVDYPHHEGSWGIGPGHLEYLRATFGAAGVPLDEALLMLGENAIDLWGLDRGALQRIANSIGPSSAEILTQPEQDEFPRGDVHKPLVLLA